MAAGSPAYLLIQAVIVRCLLVLKLPLPEPRRIQRDRIRLTEAARSGAVRLPHHRSALGAPGSAALFGGRSTGRATRSPAWSVFLPRFINGVEVAVNGADILDSRRDPAANRPDRNTPEIAAIPAALLVTAPMSSRSGFDGGR